MASNNEKKSFLESFKGLLFISDTRNTRPIAGAMLVAHEASPLKAQSTSENNSQPTQNVNQAQLSIMKRMFGI